MKFSHASFDFLPDDGGKRELHGCHHICAYFAMSAAAFFRTKLKLHSRTGCRIKIVKPFGGCQQFAPVLLIVFLLLLDFLPRDLRHLLVVDAVPAMLGGEAKEVRRRR